MEGHNYFMNNTWAIEQLKLFIEITESKNASTSTVMSFYSVSISPRNLVLTQWAIVQKILEVVYPNWRNEEKPRATYEFGQQRDAAIHARALLENEEAIREHLQPEGPTFSSEKLHPSIWGPASHLWGGGHFRSAVQAASMSLDKKLQDFAKRLDVSGSDLVNQTFSDSPPALGKPRIRVPAQINDETTRSLQQGMRALGQACFSISRNLSSHALQDLTEQEGLEQLAMLSLFARLLDTCSLVTI